MKIRYLLLLIFLISPDLSMALPWSKGVEVVSNGTPLPFKIKGRTITFTVKPDAVYALTPSGQHLEDVPMVQTEIRTDGSPARIGMTWYGLREGANNHTSTFPLW